MVDTLVCAVCSRLKRLLDELRDSPTDLAKLVQQWASQNVREVTISINAIEGWTARDPGAWRVVREWLGARRVTVKVVLHRTR
jgi:hypothetical protein